MRYLLLLVPLAMAGRVDGQFTTVDTPPTIRGVSILRFGVHRSGYYSGPNYGSDNCGTERLTTTRHADHVGIAATEPVTEPFGQSAASRFRIGIEPLPLASMRSKQPHKPGRHSGAYGSDCDHFHDAWIPSHLVDRI